MSNNLNKVGPCGTCCTQCIASKDDPNIIKMLTDKGFPKEALPCKGCREIDGYCPSPSLGCSGLAFCIEPSTLKKSH